MSKPKATLSIRIDFGPQARLGPGKVRLLEAIERTGSISAAGRALEMSYKRSWDLIDEMNRIFGVPVVNSKSGGSQGGGATLTAQGQKIIQLYREMEHQSALSSKAPLAKLQSIVRTGR